MLKMTDELQKSITTIQHIIVRCFLSLLVKANMTVVSYERIVIV